MYLRYIDVSVLSFSLSDDLSFLLLQIKLNFIPPVKPAPLPIVISDMLRPPFIPSLNTLASFVYIP